MTKPNPFSDEEIEAAPDVASQFEIPTNDAESTAPPVDEDSSETVDTPVIEDSPDENDGEQGEALYAGKYKTPEDLSKAYENLESLLGRQAAEYKEKLRQQEELMEQLLAAEIGQQQGSYQQTAPADIESFALERPDAAMAWAVEENRAAVPDVLAAIESVNPRLAREYELGYTQLLAEERMAAHTEPLMRQMQEQQQAMQVAQSFEAFRSGLGDDYEAIKDVLPEVIAEHAELAEQMDPAQFLSIMGSIAKGRSVPRIEAAVKQREQAEAKQRRLAAAETSSAPVAAQKDTSEEDEILQAMFKTQRKYSF